MKHLVIFFVFLIISNFVTAQCYIQYTYDTSGNRIKREYVGCNSKPAPKDNVEELVLSSVSDSILGVRTELIRKDLESKIRVFPNPTIEMINIQTDRIELDCLYTITSIKGQQIVEGKIEDHTTLVDLSQYLYGTYLLTIRSPDYQIIYSTSIIKQ